MKILGIIPARYASSRFPGKPLVDIHGKPMIQHVFEQARKALDYLFVATDDKAIKEAVMNFDGRVVMTDKNHQSGTDRCAEAANIVEQATGLKFDVVINVQGDEPFIDPEQIQQLADCFKKNTDIATLIKPVEDTHTLFNHNKPKVVVEKNGRAIYFSRHPIPYFRGIDKNDWLNRHPYFQHIGMYGYKKEVLNALTELPKGSLEIAESLEQLRWIENGYTIQTAVTQKEGISIDTPEDLEALLKKLS